MCDVGPSRRRARRPASEPTEQDWEGLEPTPGFEPGTCSLRNYCSTAELSRRDQHSLARDDLSPRSHGRRSTRPVRPNPVPCHGSGQVRLAASTAGQLLMPMAIAPQADIWLPQEVDPKLLADELGVVSAIRATNDAVVHLNRGGIRPQLVSQAPGTRIFRIPGVRQWMLEKRAPGECWDLVLFDRLPTPQSGTWAIWLMRAHRAGLRLTLTQPERR